MKKSLFELLIFLLIGGIACIKIAPSPWEEKKQQIVLKLQKTTPPLSEEAVQEVVEEVRRFTRRHPRWKKAGEDFLLFVGEKYFPHSPYFLKICENYVKEFPEDRGRAAFCYFRLGNFWKERDEEKALVYYRQLVEQFPEREEAKVAAFEKAKIEFRLLRFEEAKKSCESFLRRWSRSKWREKVKKLLEIVEWNQKWSGKKAPDFVAREGRGEWVSPRGWRGTVVLFLFWKLGEEKKWGKIKEIYHRFSGRNFRLVSVCLFRTPRGEWEEKWHQSIVKLDPRWIHLASSPQDRYPLAKLFSVPYTPFTVLVDQKGIIRLMGAWGKTLEKVIEDLLE